MKTQITVAAMALALIGCRQGNQMNEGAGAQNDASKTEKQKIEQAAKEAQRQISDDAKAQKEKVEAQAKAAKAKLEAESKQAAAQKTESQKDVQAQTQKIEESAGAGTQKVAQQQQKDEQLTQQVKQTLGLNDQQSEKAKNIQAEVKGGTATLRGTVQSDAEKQQMESQLKTIPGITSVENKLEVSKDQAQGQSQKVNESAGAATQQKTPQGQPSDEQLTSQVKQTLGLTDPQSQKAKDIQVEVKNGAAKLSGSVQTEAEKQQMETQLRAVQGVTSVDNQLQVMGQ
jgi:osmotically-inducible protein OsmY